MWTREEAIRLCGLVEAICPAYGCHVALTGGCLYKDGDRKDCDILFYRIRQVEVINVDGLFEALRETISLEKVSGCGWVHKAKWNDLNVDCFFPESDGGEYSAREVAAAEEFEEIVF